MAFEKVNLREQHFDPYQEIGANWTLLTAKKDGVVNTMTASWGHMGPIWGKDTAIVYIRPTRYTKEFVDSSDIFTITFFEGHKPELTVLGRKSGRDGDKIAEVGFHVTEVEGQPTFEEGTYTLVVKKLYTDWLKEENFVDTEVMEKCYPEREFHMLYVVEILAVYKNV